MDGIRIPVSSAADIVTARLQGRVLAERAGLAGGDLPAVSAVISEIARNIANSALGGKIAISIPEEGGIVVVARARLEETMWEIQIAHRFSEFMDELKVYSNKNEIIVAMKKRSGLNNGYDCRRLHQPGDRDGWNCTARPR